MATVMYTGSSDSYDLSAADFKKLGVEGETKKSFPMNTPVEVGDEAAKVLTEGDEFSHLFDRVEVQQENADTQLPLDTGSEPEGATPQTGTDTPTTTSTTRARKSTTA